MEGETTTPLGPKNYCIALTYASPLHSPIPKDELIKPTHHLSLSNKVIDSPPQLLNTLFKCIKCSLEGGVRLTCG